MAVDHNYTANTCLRAPAAHSRPGELYAKLVPKLEQLPNSEALPLGWSKAEQLRRLLAAL